MNNNQISRGLDTMFHWNQDADVKVRHVRKVLESMRSPSEVIGWDDCPCFHRGGYCTSHEKDIIKRIEALEEKCMLLKAQGDAIQDFVECPPKHKPVEKCEHTYHPRYSHCNLCGVEKKVPSEDPIEKVFKKYRNWIIGWCESSVESHTEFKEICKAIDQHCRNKGGEKG